MEPESRDRVLEQLLESARLDEEALAALFDRACQMRYWNALCPWLSIEQGEAAAGAEVAPPLPEDELLAHLSRHGYFRSEPVLSEALIENLRRCVETLRRQRWPLVFSFVYDQFWSVLRTPSLARFLTAALGSGYRQSAHLWTYFVSAKEGVRGWRPHSDAPGMQHRLSLWIPLTDATLRNGCIYLIPKDQMPSSVPRNFSQVHSVSREELEGLLHAAKALPAPAGSVLGWDHQLIHWGSVASGADGPRISIAVEFLGPGAEPLPGERPLVEAHAYPTFRERLHLVGKALLDYQRFEPLMARFTDLGERLVAKATG